MIRFLKFNGSSFNFLYIVFFEAKMGQFFGGPGLFL